MPAHAVSHSRCRRVWSQRWQRWQWCRQWLQWQQMQRQLPGLLAACFLIWLPGCASVPEPAETPVHGLGPPLDAFVATGRIALKQRDRADNLRFRWEHDRICDKVLLMSPLGQGLAELTRDGRGARLMQPNRADIVEPDLQQLSIRVFGTPLPLVRLADWMRGAVPGPTETTEGWQVRVGETTTWRRHVLLRLLEARRQDVSLRLLVEQWGEEGDDSSASSGSVGNE